MAMTGNKRIFGLIRVCSTFRLQRSSTAFAMIFQAKCSTARYTFLLQQT